MTQTEAAFRWRTREIVKIAVYTLLLINYVLYIRDDIAFAAHELRNGGSLLEWTAAFATTIDETAWLTLLFLFELETWLLSDEVLERPAVTRLVHGVRLVCYLSLAHSVYAFGSIYLGYLGVDPIPGVTSLCALPPGAVSFVDNLEYTVVTADNCALLSSASEFYYTEPGTVVSDPEGFRLDRALALVDWLEVMVWLVIVTTIELMVRLQDRGVTRGPLVLGIKSVKYLLYGVLWLIAAWWAWLGHWHYAWDETVWIVGFFAIEANMNEWKHEIEDERRQGAAAMTAGEARHGA